MMDFLNQLAQGTGIFQQMSYREDAGAKHHIPAINNSINPFSPPAVDKSSDAENRF
jgi:hypothetical protein